MVRRITKYLVMGCICLYPILSIAQNEELNPSDLEGYTFQLNEAIKDANREDIRKVIVELESFTSHDSVAHYAHYYLAYAWYRLYNFSTDAAEKTRPDYLDHSIRHAKKAIDSMPGFVEAYVVLGNAYGVKAQKNVIAGVRYGNRAKKLFKKARELDPTNPRAAMFFGVGTLYKPAVLGGSASKAIKEFMEAIHLFEAFMPDNALTPDWGHAELYAWMGQAYEKTGEYEKGIEAYETALTIRPGYRWVRDLLLPNLLEKRSD